MEPAAACPSENELGAFALGRLGAAAAARVELHLDECAVCRSVVAESVAATQERHLGGLQELSRLQTPHRQGADDASGPSRRGSLAHGTEEWTPPTTIDEFHLARRLGAGAMGVVWLARDTLLERDVALKFLTLAGSHEGRLRFLVEARAVARIRHANILAVYQFGEVAGRPFLVSEVLRGRGLDEVTDLPISAIMSVGADLARALSAAHSAGVIHRDVKPSNAFLCDDGTAKLLDFGIAQLRTHRPAGHDDELDERDVLGDGADPVTSTGRSGRMYGTPLYMAPEAWRGEQATHRTDVYSLGAVLFTLAAGRPPSDGNTVAEVRSAALHGRVGHLARVAARAPAPFVDLVLSCLRVDSEMRPSAEDVCSELEALRREAARGSAATPMGESSRNPYMGLLGFGPDESALFFGREEETTRVIGELRRSSFVLVVGPSGAGKSSLVRAGVTPRVRSGALGHGEWSVVAMRPGPRPVDALATALAAPFGGDVNALRQALGESDGSVVAHVNPLHHLPRTLLVVDQLEEAWTLAPAEERAAFFAALARVLEASSNVRAVATLRADFLRHLGGMGELTARAVRSSVVVGALTSEGLRRAIELPARRMSVEIDPALVEHLVEAARGEPGVLPLLQFTLATLWETRAAGSPTLSLSDLERIGGLAGALAAHADAALAKLPPHLQDTARHLLLELVTIDHTRARREEADLVKTGADARQALAELVASRLVVATAGETTATYEVAHEALLSGWGTLRAWLLVEATSREVVQRIRLACGEWSRLGGHAELLLSDQQLEALDSSAPVVLDSEVGAFLAASRARADTRRRRRRLVRASVPVSIGLVLFVSWFLSTARLRARVHAAETEARVLFEQAKAADSATNDARREALALFDKDDIGPAEVAWTRMLSLEAEGDARLEAVAASLDRALSIDPNARAAKSLYAEVIVARIGAAERLHKGGLAGQLRSELGAYDDGTRATALADRGASVRLETEPKGATLVLSRYVEEADRRLSERDPREVPAGAPIDLESGSYLVVAHAGGRHTTRYPFQVRPHESKEIRIVLPAEGTVPTDMVYVPGGITFYGSGDIEATRQMRGHQPSHPVQVGAFLIERHEVTVGRYLPFLASLAPAERKDRMPQHLLLRPDGSIAWSLYKRTLAPDQPYCNGIQPCGDWRNLPIEGISRTDSELFLSWLSRTGARAGARMCTDREWERAARGGDDRTYPSGNAEGDADQACTMAAYNGDAAAAGPCFVGSYPTSRSPFGVEEMRGGEWEWTSGAADTAQPKRGTSRGGSWWESGPSTSIAQRLFTNTELRYSNRGLRICTDAP